MNPRMNIRPVRYCHAGRLDHACGSLRLVSFWRVVTALQLVAAVPVHLGTSLAKAPTSSHDAYTTSVPEDAGCLLQTLGAMHNQWDKPQDDEPSDMVTRRAATAEDLQKLARWASATAAVSASLENDAGGSTWKAPAEIQVLAADVFQKLDLQRDGAITYPEFKQALLGDPTSVDVFAGKGLQLSPSSYPSPSPVVAPALGTADGLLPSLARPWYAPTALWSYSNPSVAQAVSMLGVGRSSTAGGAQFLGSTFGGLAMASGPTPTAQPGHTATASPANEFYMGPYAGLVPGQINSGREISDPRIGSQTYGIGNMMTAPLALVSGGSSLLQQPSVVCTEESRNPYHAGHLVDCCSPLLMCLNDWSGDGTLNYLCMKSCGTSFTAAARSSNDTVGCDLDSPSKDLTAWCRLVKAVTFDGAILIEPSAAAAHSVTYHVLLSLLMLASLILCILLVQRAR